MDILYIIIACMMLTIVSARPVTFENINYWFLSNTETSQNLDLYFIVVKTIDVDKSKFDSNKVNSLVIPINEKYKNDNDLEERNADNVDNLETSAGTNVLRPLFVYRQQLAYRDHVKKGTTRHSGIKPKI